MKIAFTFILIVFTFHFAFSQEISYDEAKKIAIDFFNSTARRTIQNS